jgi:hypothetical protein
VERLAAEVREDVMNGAAWTMLICTWTVVTFFTIKFFLKVLRTPPRSDDSDDGPHSG